MRFTLAGLLLIATLLATGWSAASAASPNGEQSKTPAKIVADVKAAVATAKSCHISGAGRSAGSSLSLELWLASGKGGRGHIATGGLGFDVIRIGRKLYFKGDKKFLVHYAGATAAQLLLGKWFFVTPKTSGFSDFAPLTTLSALVNQLLASHGKLRVGAVTKIGGLPAVPVIDTTQGGTLFISAVGKPYPLELKSSKGVIRFRNWDARVTLTAPKSFIDYAKLTGHK